MQTDIVVDDPADDISTALGTGVGVNFHDFTIPVGSDYARFSLFDDYTDGEDDLDLYVFGPAPSYPQVGGSGSGTSAEQVDLVNPVPGDYIVVVHGWGTDGPDAEYTLFSWAFGPDAGNMTVTAPAAATLGTTGTVTVDWSDLVAGTKYLGAVSHSDSSGILDLSCPMNLAVGARCLPAYPEQVGLDFCNRLPLYLCLHDIRIPCCWLPTKSGNRLSAHQHTPSPAGDIPGWRLAKPHLWPLSG